MFFSPFKLCVHVFRISLLNCTIFFSTLNFAFSQTTNIMTPIDTLDNFGFSISRVGDIYSIDGNPASEEEYEAISALFLKIHDCCPCLIRYRSKVDSVIYLERVVCGREWVGEYKRYENGFLVESGFYVAPNSVPKSDTISSGMGDPGHKTGVWILFNENGDTLKVEHWQNGLLKQYFGDDIDCKIWGYAPTFQGKKLDGNSISVNSFNKIDFGLCYRNLDHSCLPKIQVSFYQGMNWTYDIIDYNDWFDFDFKQLLKISEITDYENVQVSISLLSEDGSVEVQTQIFFQLID
jgi:hypothetical protein